MKRTWGAARAKQIRKRLDDLGAAPNLGTMRQLPGKCHELTADLRGQLALSVGANFRLLFEPANDPIPRKADGGLDWTQVTAIRILGVEDYHG
jgi:toxin HigB-1